MGQLVEVALEIDVALKEQAEKVFAENGLTLEQATNCSDFELCNCAQSVRLRRRQRSNGQQCSG